MLEVYGGNGKMLAAVSDSYDIYNACEKIWGEELRQEVIDSGATVVIRPDSGDPATVVSKVLRILAKKFGYTVNDKGYKVLNHVRVLQGDGINTESIGSILFNAVDLHSFSADNIAFGQGGALLQGLDRDTMQFAMKCSSMEIDGRWVDVYKDPITDSGKRSKRGRLAVHKYPKDSVLAKGKTGGLVTAREDWMPNQLQVVFQDGEAYNRTTLAEIRQRANVPFAE
jgi:nicotinamide phosphoribosyltransferase